MKTFQEVLDGGNLADINAMLATHVKRIDTIQTEAAKRETKAATADELTEWTRLDDECEKLQAKAIELKNVSDMADRNKKRSQFINTPVDGPPQPRGNGGGEDNTKAYDFSRPIVQFPLTGSLKHIGMTCDTRREAIITAKRWGEFLLGGVMGRGRSRQWCLDNGVKLIKANDNGQDYEIKGANEGTNEAGGFLVPEEFSNMMIVLREKYGVFRPNAKIEPMGSDVRNVKRRDTGLTAYWVGEDVAITASQKAWSNVKLVAKKLAALAIYSSEIDEDAVINIADDLAGEISYAFALEEDTAGFTGDGTSTHGGITGVTTLLYGTTPNRGTTVANIAGLFAGTAPAASYSSLTLADFNNVSAKLPVYADPNAAWYVHKTFWAATMQRLELAAGGVTSQEIRQGERTGRPMFLGYPVNFTQVMPKVAATNQVCALFGDLSLAATFGDRRRVTLFVDPYSRSANDETQIRGTERIDIVVHDVGNYTATATAQVPGPIVGLITASS